LHVPGRKSDEPRSNRETVSSPDGVQRHPGGLHRRRAVPGNRGPGDGIEAEQDGDDPRHVVALLAARQAAAQHQVVNRGRVQGRNLVERGPHQLRGQVVGSHPGQ